MVLPKEIDISFSSSIRKYGGTLRRNCVVITTYLLALHRVLFCVVTTFIHICISIYVSKNVRLRSTQIGNNDKT